jgi:hypothetical protein
MFAKKEESVVSSNYYELFTIEKIKDMNGDEVEIPRSIGQYSITNLEMEKENLLKMIVDIDEKITAIETLINN